jgi:hypothetical protein
MTTTVITSGGAAIAALPPAIELHNAVRLPANTTLATAVSTLITTTPSELEKTSTLAAIQSGFVFERSERVRIPTAVLDTWGNNRHEDVDLDAVTTLDTGDQLDGEGTRAIFRITEKPFKWLVPFYQITVRAEAVVPDGDAIQKASTRANSKVPTAVYRSDVKVPGLSHVRVREVRTVQLEKDVQEDDESGPGGGGSDGEDCVVVREWVTVWVHGGPLMRAYVKWATRRALIQTGHGFVKLFKDIKSN